MTVPEPSDGELVRAAQTGSRADFHALVRRYSRTAVTLALAHAPNADPDAAEDIAQEAMIRAWTSLDACTSPDRFRSWLYTIVKRVALSTRSTSDRRRKMRDRHAPDIVAGTMSTRRSSPDEVVVNQLGRPIAAAIGTLMPRQREVLLLHDLEGRPHGEIGDLLGITAGTSRKHLSDARAKVRSYLEHANQRSGGHP